jgi:hypothetical protein
MALPILPLATPQQLFANTTASAVAGKLVEKTFDSSTGIFEPINRGTERKSLNRDYEEAFKREQRHRAALQAATEALPSHPAFEDGPDQEIPPAHHNFGFWSSHSQRMEVL